MSVKDTDPATDPIVPPRKLSRDARRKPLMQATIEVVARGYARATLTEVAGRAGLSRGLVNFHFKTKKLLPGETLGYMSVEYRENWPLALQSAPRTPPIRLTRCFGPIFSPIFAPPPASPAKMSGWA